MLGVSAVSLLRRIAAVALLLRRISSVALRLAVALLLRGIPALLAVAALGWVSAVTLLLLRVSLLLLLAVFATAAELAQEAADAFGLAFARGQLALVV